MHIPPVLHTKYSIQTGKVTSRRCCILVWSLLAIRQWLEPTGTVAAAAALRAAVQSPVIVFVCLYMTDEP